MNEHFVAIGSSSLYAEYKGGNLMPDGTHSGGPEHPNKDQKTERGLGHGDSEQAKKSTTEHKPEGQAAKPPENAFLLALGLNPHGEIPFSLAKKPIETIARLRDEKEIVFGADEANEFLEILENNGGLDPQTASGLKPEEMVVATLEVLKSDKVKIGEAEDSDYTYSGSERKTEELENQALVRATKSAGEEPLTTVKVAGLISVDETFEAAGYGPDTLGAARAPLPPWTRKLPSRNTSDEIKEFVREVRKEAGRPPENELDALKAIDNDLRSETKRLTGKDRTDALKIRDVVRARVDSLTEEIQKARQEAIRAERETPPAEELLTITTETKNLLADLVRLDEGTPDWIAKQAELQEIIGRCQNAVTTLTGKKIEDLKPEDVLITGTDVNTFRYVFEVTKAVDDFTKFLKEPAKRAKVLNAFGGIDNLDLFINASKNEHKNLLVKANNYFSKLYENYGKEEQLSILGDINERANYYLGAILGGWRDLDAATREILTMSAHKEDQLGLREWRTTRYYQRLIDAVRIHQETQRPADWGDVTKTLSSIYSYVEDSGVGGDELGPFLQRASGIIESMPADTQEGRDMRTQLSNELDAFKAVHILFITGEQKDLDPKALAEAYGAYFNGREERTFEDFVVRYSRDTRGRDFYFTKLNAAGDIVDKEKVNIFDPQHELYSNTLRDERIRMNMVEEMTKFGLIEKGFDPDVIEAMKKNVGFDGLTLEWQAKWEGELETLRQYFVEKTQVLIDKNSASGAKWDGASLTVDQVWARFGGVPDKEGVLNNREFIKVTFDLINDYRKKRTLHGAFGNVLEGDKVELANQITDELTTFGVDNDRIIALTNDLEGRNYIDVRRDVMKAKFRQYLEVNNLSVNRNRSGGDLDLRRADFDELDEVGFFGSVDVNAYQWAWMVQWGNFEGIRVYSPDKKTKYDDNFEMVTYHDSTNLFNVRNTAHGWEFFHTNVENRGRPKDNDVNVIIKQKLPGKHHYIFPQNTPMVRWADHFMTPDQKEAITTRTRELMREYDFDNPEYHDEFEGWMRSVAIMDMIENGQFSMGQKKFSEVVKSKALTKFAGIDLYTDIDKDKSFLGPEIFQDYLTDPTEEKFIAIMNKKGRFYSTRVARAFAAIVLLGRGHLEVAMKHRNRLFNDPNLTSAGAENLYDRLVSSGNMYRNSADHEKRKELGFKFHKIAGLEVGEWFGTVPFRRFRQTLELARRLGWDSKLLPGDMAFSGVWAAIMEFLKQLPRQSLPQS